MKKVNCILLIDDNPGDNYLHSYILREMGICNVIKTATDGVDALSYLKKTLTGDQAEFPKPDLIFLDINMPRMNGFEFLEEYRKLDEILKTSIVVIMLTSSLHPDDLERAKRIEEVKEFINKPLENELLDELFNKYF